MTEKKTINVDKLVWRDSGSNKYVVTTDQDFEKSDPPVTGDTSLIWGLLAAMSAFGLLCTVAAMRRKYN